MLTMRKTEDWVTGLAELVCAVGGDNMTAIEVGVYAGQGTGIILGTGKVHRLYCVDPWKPGYNPADPASDEIGLAEAERTFDAGPGKDDRVTKVKASFADAVALRGDINSLPSTVDFIYIDGDHRYAAVSADIKAAMSIDTRVVGGHNYSWSKDVQRAVHEAFGKPDRVFPDSSWVIYNPRDRYRLGGTGISSIDVTQANGASVTAKPLGLSIDKCADRTFLLCYTGNSNLADAALSDARRVGLSVERIWQFPTPFDKHFTDSVPHIEQLDEKPGWTNNWFGHYRAVKTAYELGCDRALILEDDCRFMLDTKLLNDIVADVPADFDMALLDHFFCRWDSENKDRYEKMRGSRVTKYWSSFDHSLFSAACYLVSRKAMARLIWLHESIIDDKTPWRMMRLTDYWHNRSNLGESMHLYFCTPNCAIQRNENSDSARLSNTTGINRDYVNMGIRFTDYAERG